MLTNRSVATQGSVRRDEHGWTCTSLRLAEQHKRAYYSPSTSFNVNYILTIPFRPDRVNGAIDP